MTTLIVIVGVILLGTWIVYNLSQRIGEEQEREWKQFLIEHPELVKKPEPVVVEPKHITMTEKTETEVITLLDKFWQDAKKKSNETKNS